MDPRHPEQSVSRMTDLMTQFNSITKDISEATTSAALGQLEREGSLVVQEICLVAPRLHEAMMQASRNRRHDLTRGTDYDKFVGYSKSAEYEGEPEIKMSKEAAKELIEKVGGEEAAKKLAKKSKKKTTKKTKKAKK